MCCWSNSREQLTITLVVVALSQWELDLTVVELFNLRSACLDSSDLLNFDDLDGIREM